MIQQGGAGGFACRSHGHNQWSASKLNKFPKTSGGNFLTGPVYVEGAEPGDVLEVKILFVDLAIDSGYNGCIDFVPTAVRKIIALDRAKMSFRCARSSAAWVWLPPRKQ